MDDFEKEKLYSQIQEEYGRVMYSYTTHLKMVKQLVKKNEHWKWAQIILSACSTSAFISIFLSDERWISIVGALISTLLLIINSYLKDIDHSGDSKSHLQTSKELWLIRSRYISLLTDFNSLSAEEIRNMRDDLLIKTHRIYQDELDTNEKAYNAAQKALKQDDEQFFTQDELNKMLPKSLRKGDQH